MGGRVVSYFECSARDPLWVHVTDEIERRRYQDKPKPGKKPVAIITSERLDDLSSAIHAKGDELIGQITGRTGSSHGAAHVDVFGRSASAIFKAGLEDGTDLVWHVSASEIGRTGEIEVGVEGPWIDSHDAFWVKEHADRSNAVVIGGEHYRIQPDSRPGTPGYCLGYGGALFRIRRHGSDEVIETRNLWHQGTVPPSWRDRLPDDAEFVKTEAPVRVTL